MATRPSTTSRSRPLRRLASACTGVTRRRRIVTWSTRNAASGEDTQVSTRACCGACFDLQCCCFDITFTRVLNHAISEAYSD